MKVTIAFILSFIATCSIAQNPFSSIGKEAEVLSLTNGKYDEVHENDSLVRIGSVIYDTRTNKIAYFVEEEVLQSESTMEPTVVSRWLSRDPLAHNYPHLSPYHFGGNNPILYIDVEGNEIKIFSSDPGAAPIVYQPNMKEVGDEFQRKAIKALNSAYNLKDNVGKEVVGYLVSKKSTYELQHGEGSGRAGQKIFWNEKVGNITNKKNPKTGSNREAPDAILFHEAVHAYIDGVLTDMLYKARELYEKGEISKEKLDQWEKFADKTVEGGEELIIENYENVMSNEKGYGLRVPEGDKGAWEGSVKGEYETEDPCSTEGCTIETETSTNETDTDNTNK